MAEHTLVKSTTKLASNLATFMFIVSKFQQCLPSIIRNYLNRFLYRIIAYFQKEVSITFYEYKNGHYGRSRAYTAIENYIGSISSGATRAKRLRGDTYWNAKKKYSESLVFSVEDNEDVRDEFENVKVTWHAGKVVANTTTISYYSFDNENRYYTLSYNQKHRKVVMDKYLPYVMDEGEAIQNRRRTRMMYTNNPSTDWKDYKRGYWSKIVFDNPATFDNLAMDPTKKEEIIEDLMTFSKSRDYYKRIGKAWKRGYLLYGPPGTGKSTMIACMANLLGYDVYDLELTTIKSNSELRTLLINTGEKAIIVIEDIDCSLPITGKRKEEKQESNSSENKDEEGEKKDDSNDSDILKSEKDNNSNEAVKGGGTTTSSSKKPSSSKVTFSGLLNFIDGLWSPCAGERIIVFTTNHIEKLDPALIRTGRMDKHIELSYCSFEAFKVLARNYLGIESHPLFDRIKTLLKETKITPSDLAENLLPKSRNMKVEKRLEIVIQAIEKAKEVNQKQVKPYEDDKLDAEMG